MLNKYRNSIQYNLVWNLLSIALFVATLIALAVIAANSVNRDRMAPVMLPVQQWLVASSDPMDYTL